MLNLRLTRTCIPAAQFSVGSMLVLRAVFFNAWYITVQQRRTACAQSGKDELFLPASASRQHSNSLASAPSSSNQLHQISSYCSPRNQDGSCADEGDVDADRADFSRLEWPLPQEDEASAPATHSVWPLIHNASYAHPEPTIPHLVMPGAENPCVREHKCGPATRLAPLTSQPAVYPMEIPSGGIHTPDTAASIAL